MPNEINPMKRIEGTETSYVEKSDKTTATKKTADVYSDTATTSSVEKKGEAVTQADEPQLSKPDTRKTEGEELTKAIQFLKKNEWLMPAFLSLFSAIINEMLATQRDTHLKEAHTELDIRNRLYEGAKSNAELQKLLTNNQAKEHFIQALSAFVSAASSTVQLVQTAKLNKLATERVDNKIKDSTSALENAKIAEIKTLNPGFTDAQAKAHVTANPNHNYVSQDVVDKKKTFDYLTDNKDKTIQKEESIISSQIQQAGDMQKQMMNSAAGVIQGMIKEDSALKEEMKALMEGSLQAMNKYSESTTKSRDNARANYDRFVEFMNQIVQTVNKSQTLRG